MSAKILIIDDEASILNALQIFLEQEGYSVEACDNYDGHLEEIGAEDLPDVIILDILLRNDDGRSIAKKLKSSPKTRHIPIILISAHPTAFKSIKQSGADAFLAKPFSSVKLLETVGRLCNIEIFKSKFIYIS